MARTRKRRVRALSTFEPATNFYRDLLPRLTQDGLDVEVVLSRSEYRSGRFPLRHAMAGSGVRVTETPATRRPVSGASAKLLAMIGFTSTVVARTLFGRRVDLNMFFSTPPFFALWGAVLKVVRKQPYVCIVQDVYPDLLVADGVISPSARLTRLLRLMTRVAWRRADAVVVIGRCMGELVESTGVERTRIHLIHNWSHDGDQPAFPIGESELREELGLRGKFVVEYSGNLGLSHTFDEILAVARNRRAEDDGVSFVFIGDGRRRADVEDAKERDSLDNVILLPFQPTHRLRQSLALADVHLVTLRSGFEGIVVPSKAYGALASGRPVIYVGDARGEIARTIIEHRVGVVVEPGDVRGLSRSISRYVGDAQLTSEEGARAATLARGELGRDTALAAWSDLVRQLVNA